MRPSACYGHMAPNVSVLTGFYLRTVSSFFLKSKMFFTDPVFQTFVKVKIKLTPGHNIVKFSSRFTRLGFVLVDPQHLNNAMMRFYNQ